jgi:alpha-soluble NSF attachment protein
MSAAASEGDYLLEQAEKKLNGGFMASLFKGNRYEEAEELFTKAANQYKLAKKCE